MTMAGLSLMAYTLGLPAFMLVKVLAAVFYSRKDAKTPVRIAIVALLTNMVQNLVFVVVLGVSGPHAGLALATSIAAWMNTGLLYCMLGKQQVYRPEADWRGFFCNLDWPLLRSARCFPGRAGHAGMAGLEREVAGALVVCLGHGRHSGLFFTMHLVGLPLKVSGGSGTIRVRGLPETAVDALYSHVYLLRSVLSNGAGSRFI